MHERQQHVAAWLEKVAGLSQQTAVSLTFALTALLTILLALLALWLLRRILIRLLIRFISSNRIQWDNALVENGFFRRLSWAAPLLIFHASQYLLLPPNSRWAEPLHRLILCGFLVVGVRSFSALLSAVNDIYRSVYGRVGKTIRSYVEAFNIATHILGAVLLVSILTGRTPWALLSVMGGLTALTMLIFRDTILGFVAAVRLTSSDIIRVGDWIEMESHGADGDVIDVSIHAVRVRNWNKTITTIPTYALIANPFKNWRGMKESGGRRIKRALCLDMTSVRFLTQEDLERLAKIQVLKDYLRERQQAIDHENLQRGTDLSLSVNGRRQTNAGVFRAYVIAWLKQNPNIHQEMTFLVRQLEPGPTGLPLELYVFSRNQIWADYEAIQADIFDHLLAALPCFDLRIFQAPSGYDFRRLQADPLLARQPF